MRKLLFLVAAAWGCGGTSTGASTFTDINKQTIQVSCAFTDTCHNAAGAHSSGNLNLHDDPYGALVNVPADDAQAKSEGKVRVKPGDSASSYLYIKLTLPPVSGACQTSMPISGYGGCMPQTSAPLDSSTIAGIKAWIDAGAMKN